MSPNPKYVAALFRLMKGAATEYAKSWSNEKLSEDACDN